MYMLFINFLFVVCETSFIFTMSTSARVNRLCNCGVESVVLFVYV